MRKIVYITVSLFLFAGIIYAQKYQRIISLAPSVTESLYELGLEQYVKGITIYCPKGFIPKETIGTVLEPNIEKITLLKPDLIIATKEGNDKAMVEKISRLGFEVYIMELSNTFDEICSNYQKLAMKLDRQKEVKNIINIARNLLNQNTQLKNLNMAKVFWEVGARPLYTAGKLSFFNDYNRYTNTINIYENIEKRYFAADIGDVVFRNPDIILIVNMKGTSTEEIKIWNAYKMMNAVKDNKVFLLKTDDVFTLTPIKFAKSVKMLRGLLSNAK